MGKSVQVGTQEGNGWSAWDRLAGLPQLTAAVLAETLDGGQAFRWTRLDANCWLGQWHHHVARLRLGIGGQVEWSAPRELAPLVSRALPLYFGCEVDFEARSDELPWRSDPHLAQCLTAFPGLRILRQPFGETLLGFLCSATKQIVQIKQMVALLAQRHGEVVARVRSPDSEAASVDLVFHRLPTWSELAGVPESELRACLLGFRAHYIAETARFLHAHPGWLEETETLPYEAAKERLCSLPGVGEKVADCILLFGAGQLEAFPVDVWILKTMEKRYGLAGWKPAQLTQFGRAHFGRCAGLAQQYLFAWERRFAPRNRAAP